MNKILFIALAVSVFVFGSCNMTKNDQKLSYNAADQLENEQVLTGQVSNLNKNITSPLDRIEPKFQGSETSSGYTMKELPAKLIPQNLRKKEHRNFTYSRVQGEVKNIKRLITKSEFESHTSSIKDKTPLNYGQISSFFLVFGALFILVVSLINPVLFLTLGIVIPCLILFILGITTFFFWLRNANNADPMALSYGEFALMFFLAGLIGLLFALWLIYFFSFLLLAGALILGIIWLIHLKDKFKVPEDK